MRIPTTNPIITIVIMIILIVICRVYVEFISNETHPLKPHSNQVYICFIVIDSILISILFVLFGYKTTSFYILLFFTALNLYDITMGIFQSFFDVYTRSIIFVFVMMSITGTIELCYTLCCKRRIKL